MDFRNTMCVGAAFLLAGNAAPDPSDSGLPTSVMPQSAARFDQGPWGSIWVYSEGTSANSQDMFKARIELKPGAEIHPPHQHSEDEYLLVISGRGRWTLGDKHFEANAGDLLYARPGDLHGIVAAADSELTFFVWKWRSAKPA
jgi:quercetin dioxygenase-like cupin family protein